MAAIRKVSPLDDRSRNVEWERAPAKWASATEQLHELSLVVLVLREHGAEVARHDLQRCHRRVAVRRRHVGEYREIALGDRLALRLVRKLPGDECLRRLGVAGRLEDSDRLADGGYALLREDEVNRGALRPGIERHVFNDDPVALLATRHRFNDGAVALAGNRAISGERLEIAPAELRLLHHGPDMD